MDREADKVTPDVQLVDRLVDHSVGSLRVRRRRTWVGLVVGVASLTVLAATVGPSTDGQRADAPPPERVNTPDRVHHDVHWLRWTKSLPRGEDARASYFVLNTMYSGNASIDAPGPKHWDWAHAMVDELHGASNAGWVVSLRRPGGLPLGVLTADGDFTAFPAFSPTSAAPSTASDITALVSPDGEWVAYSVPLSAEPGRVIDASSGETVSRLPSDAAELVAWTPAGIVYRDREYSSWVWSPGGSPVDLHQLIRPDASGWFVQPEPGGCWRVGRVEVEGLATLVDNCQTELPIAVSPTAQFLLTARGEVLDGDTGEVLSRLAIPTGLLGGYPGLIWEDDATVLIPVRGMGTGDAGIGPGPWPTVITRCDVRTDACERASPVRVDYTTHLDLFPLLH